MTVSVFEIRPFVIMLLAMTSLDVILFEMAAFEKKRFLMAVIETMLLAMTVP